MNAVFVRRVRAVIIAAAVAAFVIAALHYVFSGVAPFGFYYDLGVNIAATQQIDASIRSLADLKDALGWATWDNAPQFSFNPMLGYAVLVPFSKLFGHDPMTAVKAVQVLECLVAFGSMFLLYRVVRGTSRWAWLAGALYACLPFTMLQVQGNVEFGLASALAPLALALCLKLIRSIGAPGLPLCGFIAGVIGSCITIEYLFFYTLPIYAVSVLAARRERRILLWGLAGLIVAGLAASYCIIPTLAYHTVFSQPAAHAAASSEPQYGIFSESALALFSLLMTEGLVGAPPFNALPHIVWALLPGIILWVLAGWFVVRSIRRGEFSAFERALLLIVAVCVALALGANLPLVSVVWLTLSHLPVLSNLRTPDRFVALPFLGVALWGVAALERLSVERPHVRTWLWVVPGLILTAFAFFGFFQYVFQSDRTVAQMEPALNAVNGYVAQVGGRTVSMAFVHGGSIYDFPDYGYSTPYLRYSWDVMGRYMLDGVAGAGIFGKAGVRSIIATPNWTTNGQGLPNPIRPLSASALLEPRKIGPVYVYNLRTAHPLVYASRIDCYRGSPGVLDRLEALPVFQDVALASHAGTCNGDVFADWNSLDSAASTSAVRKWSGQDLFPHAPVLRDYDYAFRQGRNFLTDPWYRNSVDGDPPILGPGGAAELFGTTSTALQLPASRAASLTLDIRAVCRAASQMVLHVAGQGVQRRACMPRKGYQWLHFSIAPSAAARAVLRTSPLNAVHKPPRRWTVAVDGAMLSSAGDATPMRAAPSATFIISDKHFRVAQPEGAEDSSGSFVRLSAGGTSPGSVAGQRVSYNTITNLVYRWMGPSGRYIVSASAWISGYGAMLGLAHNVPPSVCCASTAVYNGGSTIVERVLDLHRGDTVVVQSVLPAHDPNASATFTGVQAVPTRLPGSASSNGDRSYAWNFSKVPLPASQVVLHADRFRTGASKILLDIAATGSGRGTASLQCPGGGEAQVAVGPGNTLAAVSPGKATSCRIRLELHDVRLDVGRVALIVSHATVALRKANQWMPSGWYSISEASRFGQPLPLGNVLFDGKRLRGNRIFVPRGGVHRIALFDSSANFGEMLFSRGASAALPSLKVRQAAAARWEVTVPQQMSVEAAVLPDGNWVLHGDGKNFRGFRCDLVNTCFPEVPAGQYLLLHLWPAAIRLGFAMTLLALLFACASAYAGRRARESIPSLARGGRGTPHAQARIRDESF